MPLSVILWCVWHHVAGNSAGAVEMLCLIMLGGTFGFNKKWQMDPGYVHKYFGWENTGPTPSFFFPWKKQNNRKQLRVLKKSRLGSLIPSFCMQHWSIMQYLLSCGWSQVQDYIVSRLSWIHEVAPNVFWRAGWKNERAKLYPRRPHPCRPNVILPDRHTLSPHSVLMDWRDISHAGGDLPLPELQYHCRLEEECSVSAES